jgi:hypothetical protein
MDSERYTLIQKPPRCERNALEHESNPRTPCSRGSKRMIACILPRAQWPTPNESRYKAHS